MKNTNSLQSFCTAVVATTLLALTPPAGAQMLTPTIDGVSSNYPLSNYVVAGLTDGAPTLGSSAGLGNEYASSGVGGENDVDPIVKFSFPTSERLTGLDYAQRSDGLALNTGDLVRTIDLYFVSASTYANFTPTPGVTNLAVTLGAPSEIVTPSLTDGNFDTYTFTAPGSAEYVIAQFLGNEPGLGGNPGGAELRFTGSVPEPGTTGLLLGGLAAAMFLLRGARVF